MKKLLAVLLLCSGSLYASSEQWEPIINMAIEQIKRSGELEEISSCIGISENTFLSKYRPILKNCLSKYGLPEEDTTGEQLMDECFEKQMRKTFGVSKDKLLSCDEAIARSREAQAVRHIDDSLLTEGEVRMLALKEQRHAREALSSMLTVSQSSSKGTEHLITLPIYNRSEILAHYSAGMALGNGRFSLPVATFSSVDSIEEVVAFYKEQLPHFQSKTFEGGMVVFMKEIAREFDPLNNLTQYQNTPHVTIYSVKGRAERTQTAIEIAYAKS